MKIKSTLALGLVLIGVTVQAQSATPGIKTYFTNSLQGCTTLYTQNQYLRWSEVDTYRKEIWTAWCEANKEFKEDKLPPLRPLTNSDTLSWPLPQELEPNAVMPYYYGTKGDKPSKGCHYTYTYMVQVQRKTNGAQATYSAHASTMHHRSISFLKYPMKAVTIAGGNVLSYWLGSDYCVNLL